VVSPVWASCSKSGRTACRSSGSRPVSLRYCSRRTLRKYPILASERSSLDHNDSYPCATWFQRRNLSTARRASRWFSRRRHNSLTGPPVCRSGATAAQYHELPNSTLDNHATHAIISSCWACVRTCPVWWKWQGATSSRGTHGRFPDSLPDLWLRFAKGFAFRTPLGFFFCPCVFRAETAVPRR
jgi:hypothetical protein